jgi:hypothetical protein
MMQSPYSVTDKRRLALLFRQSVASFHAETLTLLACSQRRSYLTWRYAFRSEHTECTQKSATRVPV